MAFNTKAHIEKNAGMQMKEKFPHMFSAVEKSKERHKKSDAKQKAIHAKMGKKHFHGTKEDNEQVAKYERRTGNIYRQKD